ncbi:prepilin peptidase [Paraoerskovia marina]|uniref:Leader peptidase (Prepilin peptidase) / N-methyltransferase n=1 Tax=Paraoerskovia marina TaxID=545619 RepID=A0A1H1SNC7_9CELL|nr:A24 family peptidase [Paraoerskovia marina]SDS49517.1 leader peptidase (prepilin peptidase) / N-methyltransferase [Paraoerskovia marina]
MLADLAARIDTETRADRRVSLALSAALVLAVLVSRWPAPDTVAFVVLAVACGPLTVIDLRSHRLPDALTGPTAAAALVVLGLTVLIGPDTLADLGRAALGAFLLLAAYLALAIVRPGGLGLGDVKLAGVVGLYLAWCGWEAWFLGTFAAFTLGGLWALALLLARRATGTTAFAFGPFMLVGAAVAIGLDSAGAFSF